MIVFLALALAVGIVAAPGRLSDMARDWSVPGDIANALDIAGMERCDPKWTPLEYTVDHIDHAYIVPIHQHNAP